jgi:hypothetical protein
LDLRLHPIIYKSGRIKNDSLTNMISLSEELIIKYLVSNKKIYCGFNLW